MDRDTAGRFSKHLLRLASETLTTIQNDGVLSRMCERGMDPGISHGELQAVAQETQNLSIFGNMANETSQHRAAVVIQIAVNVRMYGMEGEYNEAWLNLCTYPNAYAIVQAKEGGGSYDSRTPEARGVRTSVMNALTSRCAAFAPEFTAAYGSEFARG